MSKEKLIGDITFALKQKQLKPGEHFELEVKIGGGQKTVHIKFKDPKHIEDHRRHLEQVAQKGNFIVNLKAAA
jgi:hypothetical protein